MTFLRGYGRGLRTLLDLRQHTRLLLTMTMLGLLLGAALVWLAGMRLWSASLIGLALLLYPAGMKWRDDLARWGWPLTVLSVLVALQGFHTIEHLVQWAQKYILGWAYQDSSGLISPLNAEIVHFVWNWTVVLVVGYLLWSGLRHPLGFLLFAWSLAHSLEHLYLFVNYLETLRVLVSTNQPWSLAQGQPGIFGRYGWLAQNVPDSAVFICNLINPSLLNGQRLDIHFWWNMWEALLMLFYAAASMRRHTLLKEDDAPIPPIGNHAYLAQANAELEEQVAARTADLRAALTQIEELMQARSAMVLDVAHDLCNYTQNLRAHATFLEWSYADLQAGVALTQGEDLPVLLMTLHRAIDRVIDFTRGLQEAALLDQQRLPLHSAPCRLFDTISQLITPLSAVFAQQRITLIVCPPAQEVIVAADPTYLQRVIENVLGNALKFTAQHRADVTGSDSQVIITWAIAVSDTQAQITITDTGIGIAPEDLARLGERFTCVHQRPIVGSGVGLHFARRVTEAMGGQLQIASAGLGCGTTVTLVLPLATASLPMQEFLQPRRQPIRAELNERQRSTRKGARSGIVQ